MERGGKDTLDQIRGREFGVKKQVQVLDLIQGAKIDRQNFKKDENGSEKESLDQIRERESDVNKQVQVLDLIQIAKIETQKPEKPRSGSLVEVYVREACLPPRYQGRLGQE